MFVGIYLQTESRRRAGTRVVVVFLTLLFLFHSFPICAYLFYCFRSGSVFVHPDLIVTPFTTACSPEISTCCCSRFVGGGGRVVVVVRLQTLIHTVLRWSLSFGVDGVVVQLEFCVVVVVLGVVMCRADLCPFSAAEGVSVVGWFGWSVGGDRVVGSGDRRVV